MLMGTDPLRELGSTAAAAIDRSVENGGSPATPTASCGIPRPAPHGSTLRAATCGRHTPQRVDQVAGQAGSRRDLYSPDGQ
jgi:hypothetical protein